MKEILGIPAHMTEIVLLPVAWTKGTEFRRAPRHPARAITYFDRFGTTSEHGPGETLRFEDGPGAIAEIDIDAPPAAVWALVTDVNVPTRFSEEFLGAEWQSDERGVGAVFIGRNQHAGDRRVDAAVHRRRLRRTERLRLAHLRSRQPGRPVALRPRTGRRPHPAAVQLRHRAGPVGHDDGDHRQPGQGGPRPAPPPQRGAGQHAAHRRGHQAARRGVAMTLRVGIAAMPLERRPASSSSARPSGSASTRCGCPSSGPPTP